MKKVLSCLSILIVMVGAICITSCSNEDELSPGLNGKWKLQTYNGKTCTHGEYWEISGNTLKWNKRIGGRSSTYSISVSGNSMSMRCTYDSKGNKENYSATFAVKNKVLTASVSDNIVRVFKK